jgi:hypothetical protein
MIVRMKVNVRGGFLGREPVTGIHSVLRGDVVDVPESHGLQLIMRGDAEATLDGPVGRAGQQPAPRDIAKMRARIAELAAPDPVDVAYQQLVDRRKSGRAPTPAEDDTLRRALSL